MNGKLLKELQALEASGELPQKVSNRLVLAGVVQLYEKIENGRYEKRISVLEKVVAIVTTLLIAVLGWISFGSVLP